MSIKPTASPVWPGGVLDVRGRDAQAFLHAQLMSDVKALAPGAWQWTGWLTAKGRVLALGALQRVADEHFRWLLPDHPAAGLGEQLQRFVFRSKVAFETPALALAGFRAPQAEGIALGGRWLGFGDSQVSHDEWAVEDLAHGLPRLPPAAIGSHTPQMLGLDFLGAYSVKKGCYPGQEIVARTHFLGQAKRRLQRLSGDHPFAAGESLEPAGEVLCAASFEGRHEAQAVLPIEPPAGRLQRAGNLGEARPMPFLPGLAR
jgi:tRNA-modifying protein YgfZ